MTLDHLGMGEGFEYFFHPKLSLFPKALPFSQGSTFLARGKYNKLSYIHFLNVTLSIHLFALVQGYQVKYISL